MSSFKLVVLFCLIFTCLSFAADSEKEGVLFRDGFEQLQNQRTGAVTPKGWSIWGDLINKSRSNFVIDFRETHSGRASFRIHHLPKSGQFVVLDIDRAIRPQKGRAYTFSFWAKADKDTEVFFGVNVYSTFQPKYERAFSPDYRPIHVTSEWTRFSFTFNEGLHFFMEDRAPYLLLTFLPTLQPEEDTEKTFWIDDVLVTESKNPTVTPPVASSVSPTLQLEHGLKPGKEVHFNVDATRRIRPCYREVAGISFWRLSHPVYGPFNKEGEYFLDPGIEQSIGELHLPMTRMYGIGDEPAQFGKTSLPSWSVEDSIDRVAALCKKIGTPEEWFFLELENPEAHSSLPPEVWARAVKYAKEKGYSFRYWEVSNEPYAIFGKSRVAFPTPRDYLRHFLLVSRAIHESDPQAKVGISIAKDNPMWSSYLLREAAGSYDFVVPHLYTFSDTAMSKEKFTDVVLTKNAKVLNSALELNTRIRYYNPKREVPILDTEWGLHGLDLNAAAPAFVARDSNIWAGIHDAVRLIYYAREGMVRGASAWSMLSPNRQNPGLKFLFADAPDQRSIRYWLYYYFSRHLGDWVVQLDGTTPFFLPEKTPGAFGMPMTPAVSTVSDDGKRLFLVVANAEWQREFDCSVHLQGFSPGHVTAYLFSDFRENASVAHPLIEHKEDAVRNLEIQTSEDGMTFKLPGHSVALIQVIKSPQTDPNQ